MAGSPCVPTTRIARAAIVLGLLLALTAGLAQLAQAQDGPHLNVIEVSTTNYPAIKITFEALDSADLPVVALDRNAFAVYENGQPQEVVSGYALQASPTPLTVMLVLDTSLSMADDGRLQKAQEAATAFVAQMRPQDRVGLIRFDSTFAEVKPLTNDRGELMTQIAGLTAKGNTRLYDALNLAVDRPTAAHENYVVVLLTDGKDTESATDLAGVLTLIQDTGVRVYTIGIGNDIEERVLAEVAMQSGGRFYAAPTSADIGYTFRLMSDQLRYRYEVVYSSPATAVEGSNVELRLTAETPQGLASTETAYVAPAFVRSARQDQIAASQRQTLQPTTASADLRTAYIGSALAALGVLLAAGGLAFSLGQRARQARLAFFVPRVSGPIVAGGSGPGASNGSGPIEEGQSLFGAVLVALASIVAKVVTRLLPPNQVQRLSRQLTLAGNPFGGRVSHFVAVKCLMALAVPAGGLFLLQPDQVLRGLVLAAGFGFLGFRLPTFWLKRQIKARQNSILRSLPDALDLLTICVEAGLGLDGAMLEVVNKWENALSEEFAIVLAEMKMGRSRHDALRNLSQRTGVQEVTTFCSAMVQADELGMGIARPLALQAQQLRITRRQRAEKLAHEAGIKIVMAMGLFIMPALFMIILSPAVVQLQGVFNAR